MSTPTEKVLDLAGFIVEVDNLTKTESGKSEEQVQNVSKVDQLAAKKNDTTISSANNNYARTISTELWLQAVSYLTTKDLKNFRLSSNRCAVLGSEHFIQTFTFQTNRLDLERLEMISREYPRTLKNVQEIRFEKGFVPIKGMYRVLHKEYRESFKWDAEGRYVEQNARMEPINSWEILSEYLWYTSWNKAAQNYNDLTRMTKASEDLKNATCIRFSASIPNFKSEALTHAWAKVTLPKAYGGLWKARELETVMLAAHNSKVKVRQFVHDSAPTAFFTQDLNQLENTLKPFRDLESLELLSDGMQQPISGFAMSKRFWTGLWKAAQLAPNLETLHLGLLTGGYCDFNVYEYVPLRKVLGNFTWPSLTRLRVDNMTLCEKDLTNFLLRHASSLRHLTLSHIYLCRGSFQGLFKALREGLKLESLHVDGPIHSAVGLELWYFFSKNREVIESSELTEAENFRERLLTEAKLQFYKDNKDRQPGKSWLLMQEDGLADELSARLSAFVLNKGDWPSELISKLAKAIVYNGRVGGYGGLTDGQMGARWDDGLAEELLDTDTASWAKFKGELPEHTHWLMLDWAWKNEPSYPSSKWALWEELEEETRVRALHDASFARKKAKGGS
ncbi:uncharacterized protein Bfra_006669 [Botrytis fragariae]|uniref:F-box domain-containing protein n=1 Tax=Botrytis fragariae TaxID=1964551 RepID=A0A8H6B4W0_9HELO|nr:uncharacterized protein Bfra_006669 [Botrytis fragariae]KAF5879461.1 hypothetical protein Bfra_006669 [Botrytis fragariae]